MRRLQQKLVRLGLILILTVGLVGSSWLTLVSEAASCTFTVSGDEVEVGETFTLTLSCVEEGATLITYAGKIVYDTAYLEYQGDVSEISNIVEMDGFVALELTFKALKSGTTTVKFEFTDQVWGEGDEPMIKMTGNSTAGTVTITEPTTEEPTTEEPTTEEPATEEPTTEEPTTEEPTTEEPTTEEPTTEEPTTEEPTTEEPTEAETMSSDAKLDALSVSPGALSPSFSPDVHWYDVYVDNEVTVLNVDAVTSDVNATWVVTDTRKNLEVGKNYVGVKVTAQDGTVRWYEMYVYRAAAETEAPTDEPTDAPTDAPTNAPTDEPPTEPETKDPLAVVIGSVSGTVQETLGEVSRPEGFEETTYNYNGVDVEALKGIGKDLLLIPVSDGTNTKLYIFDEENGGFYPYVGVQTKTALYTVLPFEAGETVPAGYSLTTIDFQGTQVDAWVRSDAADKTYTVFYAMNWNGETALYRYDAGENTLQRVNKAELAVGSGQQDPSAGTEGTTGNQGSNGNQQVSDDYLEYYEDTLKRVNRRDTFMFILMVILLVCMIAMYLLFVVGNKDEADKDEAGETESDDEETVEDESDDLLIVDDVDDEAGAEEAEQEEMPEREDAAVLPEEIWQEDAPEQSNEQSDEKVDEELQNELADIQVGMADFVTDLADAEEDLEDEDLEDEDLEDLDFDNL